MSEQAAAFDALLEEFYPVWFRYHPDLAIRLGVEGFENLLPATDDDELAALGAWLESLMVAMGELEDVALDQCRGIDYRLLLESAQLEYRELYTRDWRHLDPTRFLPVQEIFLLTLHPHCDLRDPLLHLLQAAPGYLRQARTQLHEMPELIAPEMAAVAMDEAQAGMDYLKSLCGSVWLRSKCGGGDVQNACGEAIYAIRSYTEALRDDVAPHAQGRLGCGEDHFRRLLEHRHFISVPLDSLRTYVQAMYRDTKRRLSRHLEMDMEREIRFSGDRRLNVYREEVNRLRAHVRRHAFIGLPEATLRIVERPVCPRPGDCSSGYMRELEREGGVFFISGHEGSDSHAGETRASIRGHCIQQSWTGAHLMAFTGVGRAVSMPRRLAPTGSFDIAWDLYVRQFLAGEAYFGDADTRVQLDHQMQALGLALLDLDLNTGRLSTQQALEWMSELVPDPERTRRRLVDLARRPADALAGVVGWMLLHQTRELQQQDDEGFSVGDFHDTLLHQGAVPPSLSIPQLFGEELWGRVLDELAV